MKEYQSLSHTRWDCKYHVAFIPKRRKKRIFGVLHRHLGEIFHELAAHKEAKIVEGHLMGDHVHMCISIPPKYAVSNVVGYLKGKSAIQITRKFGGRQKNFTGEHFWAKGYFVSTVGLDEQMVRANIRNQEDEDERYDQMILLGKEEGKYPMLPCFRQLNRTVHVLFKRFFKTPPSRSSPCPFFNSSIASQSSWSEIPSDLASKLNHLVLKTRSEGTAALAVAFLAVTVLLAALAAFFIDMPRL